MTIYAGLTKLLQIRVAGAGLTVSATAAYARQPCAHDLVGTYPLTEAGQITQRWPAYRDHVDVAARYVRREGILQATLVERYGLGFQQGDDWCVVDREAVISYPNATQRRAYEATVNDELRPVRIRIEADVSIRTGKKLRHDFGRELDLLAVTADGDLLLGEVKDGTDTAGTYLSPLQLAGYLRMWRDLATSSYSTLHATINAMIDQRERIGLLGRNAPRLRHGFRVLPALFISPPATRSTAWQSLDIVAGHLRALQPRALDGLRTFSVTMGDTGLELTLRVCV